MFYLLLLEQNTTRKEQMDKKVENIIEFDIESNGKYKIRKICDSAVCAKESDGHLSELYYLIAWKSYFKKKNI